MSLKFDLDEIAALPPEELMALPVETLRFLEWQARWRATARPEQLPPEGDWLEWGLQAGRGFGKALCFQTLIPSPDIWKPLGEVKVGDRLYDEKYQPCTVTAIFEPEITEAYRLTFEKGLSIDACADHQWVTFDREAAEPFRDGKIPYDWANCHTGARIRTTREIFDTFDDGHIIPNSGSMRYFGLHHEIKSIERIDPKPMRCLTVDSPNSMFLAGDLMIPTHNTRVGAEWLAYEAVTDPNAYPKYVIAPTMNDIRYTCFEGNSGLLNVIPPEFVADYNKTNLIITLTNGGIIRGFGSESPERLRGPQASAIWGDELAAWQNAQETWDMAMMGLRLGPNPKVVWTTTPKPIELVRKLTVDKPKRVITRGATFDNKANLPQSFLDKMEEDYAGTTMGRQEILGELIDPEEAGIIKRSWFRLWPAKKPLPQLEWVIMSLDTAFTEASVNKKTRDADYSACTVWGVFRHEGKSNCLLLDCWQEQLGLPDLIQRVRKESKLAYGDDQDSAMIVPMYGSSKPQTSGKKVDMIIIEDKGSGISLRQSLEREGIMAYAYNPGRADKLTRLHMVSAVFARRQVWLPESSKYPGRPVTWAEPMVAQLCAFTGSGSIKHDDILDAVTQAVRLMMDKNLLTFDRKEEKAKRDSEEREFERGPRKPVTNPYAM